MADVTLPAALRDVPQDPPRPERHALLPVRAYRKPEGLFSVVSEAPENLTPIYYTTVSVHKLLTG